MSLQLPNGFRYSGISAHIKPSGQPDLAVIVTDQPAVAVGVYTQNVIRAASIDWNRDVTPTKNFRGLVVNSGNANACTGERGEVDNRQMATELARHTDALPNQIAVLSTGVIGHCLPMPQISTGIEVGVSELGNSEKHFIAASNAILTTDRAPKTAHGTLDAGGHSIRLAAMAMGAGMIGPNMATMLAIVTTDARLDVTTAAPLLNRVADRSFNSISVEGHTSTNDAFVLIASGAAPGPLLAGDSLDAFENELTRMAIELAKKIPSDGEGATHLISISVLGADEAEHADRIARAIANSVLVKCAITGGDPNWGRIVSAAGYCDVALNPQEISLRINGHVLYQAGVPTDFDAPAVSQSIGSHFETSIELTVGNGPATAQHWTSDLTVDYVRFNSEYTT